MHALFTIVRVRESSYGLIEMRHQLWICNNSAVKRNGEWQKWTYAQYLEETREEKTHILFLFFNFFGVCGDIAETPVASLLKDKNLISEKLVLRIRIRTPGSGIRIRGEKKSGSWKQFYGLIFLKFFDADPDPGSGTF